MSSKILESDEVDSKYFKQAFTACIGLLQDIIVEVRNTQEFLEHSFHVPKEHQKANQYDGEESDESEDEDDE